MRAWLAGWVVAGKLFSTTLEFIGSEKNTDAEDLRKSQFATKINVMIHSPPSKKKQKQ